MNKGLTIAAAAVGGALVGAAAALLLAPQKGSRTRRDIVKFVKDNCPLAHNKEVEEIVDQIEETIAEAKKEEKQTKHEKK